MKPPHIARQSPAQPAPAPAPETEFFRMNADVYSKFEASLPKPIPGQSTSDIQAGYLLGVQEVLRQLREGLVLPKR